MESEGSSNTPKKRSWRTQAERRAEAEEALLNSAAELFARQGIPGTSLAAICEHAGYSHGLVNHHFGSKQGLIEALAEHAQASFQASLPMEGARTGRQGILAFVEAYLGAFASPGPMFRCFIVMWGAAFIEQADEPFDKFDERFRAGIRNWVLVGQEDGSISKAVDSHAFAAAILALVRGIGAQMITSLDDVSLKRVTSESHRIVDAALGTEPRTILED